MSETILAFVGMAFAAFAVWLTVRIVDRRERWAKRMGIIVVLALMLYPLSYGPSAWLFVHCLPRTALPALEVVYLPIGSLVVRSEIFRFVTFWYQDLWVTQAELKTKKSEP